MNIRKTFELRRVLPAFDGMEATEVIETVGVFERDIPVPGLITYTNENDEELFFTLGTSMTSHPNGPDGIRVVNFIFRAVEPVAVDLCRVQRFDSNNDPIYREPVRA